jgi:hypothetical protein
MHMRKTDEEAYEFYKNPDNLTTTGRVYEVPKSVLSRHVPIRFRPQTIAKAKAIAQRDGMTVSSWIRGVIEREADARFANPSVSNRCDHLANHPGGESDGRSADEESRLGTW